uniref:Protein kinase domain-containing protein n=1 Tax=Strongyloides papillosus TaxID=174720 RepID=A0A0N5BPG3_STREA
MRSDSFTTSPLHHNSPIRSMWTRNFDESHESNYNINNAKACNNKDFSNMLIKMGDLQIDENFSSHNWHDSVNDIHNPHPTIDIPQTSSPPNNIWQNFDPSNNRDDGYCYSSNLSDFTDTNKEMNNIWHLNTSLSNYMKNPALNQIQNKPLPQNNMEKVKEMYTRNQDKSQERPFMTSQNSNGNNRHHQWGNDKNWNFIYSQYQIDPKESYEMMKNYPRQQMNIPPKPVLPNNQIGATYSMYQNNSRTKSPSPIYGSNKKIHQLNGSNKNLSSKSMPNPNLNFVYPPNIIRDGKIPCDEEELYRYHKTLQMHQLAYDQIYDVALRNNRPVMDNTILPDNYHYPPTEYFRPVYPVITSKNCDRGQMYHQNAMPNIVNFCQQMNNYKRENNTVNLKIEECSAQYRQLENERKKTEAELARHNLGKKISSANTIQIPRLPLAPLKVDRLIVDYFREHARVTTLLSKMIQLREKPMPPVIHEVMAEFLDSIKNLQKMRLQERENILSYLRGEVGSYNERVESVNLLRALVDVIRTTQKARAANWCCLMWTLGTVNSEQESQIEKIIQANFQIDPPEIKFRPL